MQIAFCLVRTQKLSHSGKYYYIKQSQYSHNYCVYILKAAGDLYRNATSVNTHFTISQQLPVVRSVVESSMGRFLTNISVQLYSRNLTYPLATYTIHGQWKCECRAPPVQLVTNTAVSPTPTLQHQTQCAFKRTFFVVSPDEVATAPPFPALAVLLNLRLSLPRVLHSSLCYFRLFCKLMKFSHLCLHNFVFELDLDFILVLIIPLSTFQLSVMAAPMETEPVDTSSGTPQTEVRLFTCSRQ